MAGPLGAVSVDHILFNKTGLFANGLPCSFMGHFSDLTNSAYVRFAAEQRTSHFKLATSVEDPYTIERARWQDRSIPAALIRTNARTILGRANPKFLIDRIRPAAQLI